MNITKHISEIIFYIITIVICVVAILFLFRLLKYDDCKYIKDSDLKFHNGKILDFHDTRGILYTTFDGLSNLEFKFEISSLINKEKFQKSVSEQKEFKMGYSSNTMYNDILELVYLECDNTILVSSESRKSGVTTNLIIYIGAIVGLSILIIYLLIKLLRG